ncbi:MAG: hypothetical protein WCH07_11300 [Deltaproteobacteria bacterium]
MCQISPAEALERDKVFYDYAKGAFKERQDRLKNLDDKAGKYFIAMSAIVAILTYFVDVKAPGNKMFLLKPWTDWTTTEYLTLIVFAFACLSCFLIFSALMMVKSKGTSLDDQMTKVFENNRLIDIYRPIAVRIKDAVVHVDTELDKKANRLRWAFACMFIMFIAFVALMTIMTLASAGAVPPLSG